jgi:hypothetical protein
MDMKISELVTKQGAATSADLLQQEKSSVASAMLPSYRNLGPIRGNNVFGNWLVEPKDISTASGRDLCLFIRGTGLLNVW